MTTWTSNVEKFDLDKRIKSIHDDLVQALRDSIVAGSAVTGAPGQPEDLRHGQWQIVDWGPLSSQISTFDTSAPSVEDGISHFNGHPIHLHSPIGGFHSVALSVQGSERLLNAVVRAQPDVSVQSA